LGLPARIPAKLFNGCEQLVGEPEDEEGPPSTLAIGERIIERLS